MGYYSEVAIAMWQDDLKEMFALASSKDNALNLLKNAEIRESGNKSVIYWNSVKWYDGYDDVKFIRSFLEQNNKEYYFVRVGEEIGDIEEIDNINDRYELWDEVHPEQSIVVASCNIVNNDKYMPTPDESPVDTADREKSLPDCNQKEYERLVLRT